MLISIQEAASFLQTHYAVFDELWRRQDDSLTEAELLVLVDTVQTQATPHYLLTQLKKLRFLVETDSQAGAWELAPAFARWVEYLQQVARPVSSAVVRGRLTELDSLLTAFRAVAARNDLPEGRDILSDTRNAFQRLTEDLGQTRAAIASAVSEAKSEHRAQSALERFRRINRLWSDYLIPMLELLDPAGQLEVICSAWEHQLALSLESKFLPERRTAERIEREMQILRVALRQSFRECRNELEPLHARLRRDSLLAESAAWILAQIEKEGAIGSQFSNSLQVSTFRYSGQASQAALAASAAHWLDINEPPAAIQFGGAAVPEDSQALEDILAAIEAEPSKSFPLDDLLEWLGQKHGERGFYPVIQVFSLLVTDSRYTASFNLPISEYEVAGGLVKCGRVKLEIREAA